MNALNLRVTSVKSAENVRKNAAMRASLVTLPKQYEFSEESYCLEMKSAKTVPEQVLKVKNTFKSLGTDDSVLQFLCDLYFSSPLKHPVRNQIMKLLITAAKLGTEDELTIVKALDNSLLKLIMESKTLTESVNWNTTIASVSGCFENFESGLKALEQCINIVFPFACESVNKYMAELSVLSSPSVRNQYYLYVHNSMRLLLNCIQEYGKVLKTTHLEEIKHLNTNCKNIILDSDIPMDPRTNAGILTAYIAKLFEEYESFVAYVKNIKNPNEIAMCVGVINTCDQHDFLQYSSAIRDICDKIYEIANNYATVPNILLCATRALYQISKLALNSTLKSQSLEDVKSILHKLFIFTVAYLEHHMDSVRHICRDLMRNIVACCRKSHIDFLLKIIYDSCNSQSLSLSIKCVLLQQTAFELGADEIISNCVDLFTVIFAHYLGKDFIVNNLFETLMIAHHKEQPFEIWVQLWLNYLLNITTKQDSRLPDIEVLIVKAVKCECRVVQYIIESDDKLRIPISTKLSALWAVRKSGIKLDNFQEIMQRFSKNLQLSILSNEDETRIMALRLLVETHKTTEPLSHLECQHLITYLQYNSSCQNPATRQKSLALLSKMLIRCELNLQKILKVKKSSLLLHENQPLELKFLQEFISILVENLFEGANFSRRSVSLQLLNQCLTIAINCNLKLLTILPKTTIKALVTILGDSYESNKEVAVGMLKLIENDDSQLDLIEHYNININLKELRYLLTSVKPTDSVTASYQLEFLCNKCSPGIFGDYHLPDYASNLYAALKWILKELKQGLRMANESILEAAKFNPLYGLLFAIKHILKLLDFSFLSQEIGWRILFEEIIIICKNLTHVVAPIVNNSSPEGHLPNDFSDLPKELEEKQIPQNNSTKPCKILSSKLKKIDLNSVKTTPQMVLLCAWRTVKEVSLILGEIVLRSPIQFCHITKNYLITKQQILEIGEHFKLLLAETKHRGAFEQAYVGFSKLCCRLWTIEANDLNSLPLLWLKDLMVLISKDDLNNEKICATRRSAGVPFMVQALITSELQVGSTKSLELCMTHLLTLCSAKEKSSESRTHALNILRALFRCTDLNEAVGEFVSEGVMAAIRSYDARNWSEKNSATLLFAALITRIFGVQRTKDSDNLNIRNKMTGRVFFLRYPRLFDFFLEQLQKAGDLIQQQQKSHKLHPLLLILSRLYPSALEGTESNLKLSEFIPFISKCGGCPEMQTRYLAAKAIVALINKDEVITMILTKCADMVLMADRVNEFQLNILHGNLLQVLYLTKYHKQFLSIDLIADITCSIVTVHERTKSQNAIILKVMLDIYIEILNSLSELNFGSAIVQQLLYFSNLTNLCEPNMAYYYPVLHKSNFLYNLHIMRLILPSSALSDYMLNPPLTQVPLEQVETCLNIILLLLLKSKTLNDMKLNSDESDKENFAKVEPADYESNEILQEFEIMPQEYQFVRILNDNTMKDLANELEDSKALQICLKEVVKLSLYYPEAAMKSYAIMSLLTNFDFTLANLLRETEKHPGDVKSPMIMCVERIVQNQGAEYECAQLCLEYLSEISQPWQPDCLRFKAANLLTHISVHYPKSLEMKRVNFVSYYIKLILNLLMDDDYDIRHFTAKLVLNCQLHDIELVLPDSSSNNTLVSYVSIPIATERVVSSVAQRVFLQYTANLLCSYQMDDTYILEIFKLITFGLTLPDDENQHSSTEVEIFEKNEANVFAEPLKTVFDAVVVFKSTFCSRSIIVNFLESFLQDLTSPRNYQ